MVLSTTSESVSSAVSSPDSHGRPCSVSDELRKAKPSVADISNEHAWTRIPDEDRLWAAPAKLPPPLADPAPPLLNTHEMDWEAFERLLLAMARDLEGAYDVRRYGKLGQAQHGLDVVGFFFEQGASVYSAKRWQEFRASDLKSAVERYTTGTRPFDATRLVIGVATEVRDTTVIDKLVALRAKHQDIKIELWDKREISDRLRNQSRLVTTHFGRATAAAFCETASPSPAGTWSIAADAILRGPVAHLGLLDSLARAKQAIAADPNESARLFDQIAGRLETSGFGPHARPIRAQQAAALATAGHRTEASWLRIDLGWLHLQAGDPFAASIEVDELAKWGDEAPQEIVRCANALSAVISVRRHHSATLDQLAAAVDALLPGDRHRIDAGLALAEEAVAAREPALVASRSALLLDLAAATPRDNVGYLLAARLRMCVADCCGAWPELAATARDTYPPAITALVVARYARHLALIPEPEASIARWREAVERACIEERNDDAADWLYSLRGVRLQAGVVGNDINDLHRHAQALRAAGSGTVLPEPYRARERALANIADKDWPDALEALRRYLWRSAIGGDWSGELDAHGLLGDVFEETGRIHQAIQQYVISGDRDKLQALARAQPDLPLRLPIELLTSRPWERAAAFAYAESCADLLVDEDARAWCDAAFREISEGRAPDVMWAPNPWLAAFKSFGELALISTEDQAARFVRIGADLVPRPNGTYHLTDESHVKALIGIAMAHPPLRAQAVDQLLQTLLVDARMAELVLHDGAVLLREERARVGAALRQAVSEKNLYAGLALIEAASDTVAVVPLARQHLEAVVAPRTHEPRVLTFGSGVGRAGILVTILPEDERVRFAFRLLDFANDVDDSMVNRHQALRALRWIAPLLPDAVRDDLYLQVCPFANGEQESAANPSFPARADPLSRFRVSFGEFPLGPAGLMAAAALARSDSQYAEVERMALEQLRGASEETANEVALALAALPPEKMTLPLEVLAAHPSASLRALAGVVWAQRSDQGAELGERLARDQSHLVRQSLAGSLRGEPHHGPARTVLGNDPRRSIRRLFEERSGPPVKRRRRTSGASVRRQSRIRGNG